MLWRLFPFAIVLGLVAGSVVSAFSWALGLLMFGGGEAEAQAFLVAQPGLLIACLAGSIASSLYAGWIAARFAFGEELINAFVTGVVLVAFGLAGSFDPPVSDLPAWVHSWSVGLALPLCVTGGLLYRGRASASDTPAS
jgi:hypothetical protein